MRILCVALLIFTFSVSTFGQKADKADFNGIWQLTELINTQQTLPYKLKMTIVQNETQIKIRNLVTTESNEYEVDNIYFADQRGETNQTLFGETKIKTTSRMSGRKLSIERIRSTSFVDVDGKVVYVDYKYVNRWELSKDGNTLTNTIYNYRLGKIYSGSNQQKRIFTRVK